MSRIRGFCCSFDAMRSSPQNTTVQRAIAFSMQELQEKVYLKAQITNSLIVNHKFLGNLLQKLYINKLGSIN